MLSIPNSFIKQSMQCGLHSKTILLAALSVGVKHVFSNIWVFKDYCSASAHRLIAFFLFFLFFFNFNNDMEKVLYGRKGESLGSSNISALTATVALTFV
jgi:hypothetical protein